MFIMCLRIVKNSFSKLTFFDILVYIADKTDHQIYCIYVFFIQCCIALESVNPICYVHVASTLREHLRTHETFIVDQIIVDFLHMYHKFSIKSYVVAIY